MSDTRTPLGIRVAPGGEAWGWRLLGMRWRWEATEMVQILDCTPVPYTYDGWAWTRRTAIRKARRALRQAAEPEWEDVTGE